MYFELFTVQAIRLCSCLLFTSLTKNLFYLMLLKLELFPFQIVHCYYIEMKWKWCNFLLTLYSVTLLNLVVLIVLCVCERERALHAFFIKITIFQTISLVLYLLWWPVIRDLWCYWYKKNMSCWGFRCCLALFSNEVFLINFLRYYDIVHLLDYGIVWI